MRELELPPGFAADAFERRKAFVRYLRDGPCPDVRVLVARKGEDPTISVVIPVAGAGRRALLDALLRQLNEQTEQRFEVILVHGDRRQGRAINTGAAAARGELLVTMDDDTRLGCPELLERLLQVFHNDPTVGIAGVANLPPPDGPWVVRRAMKELPRRSSPPVDRVTDSDMAEHPCLAIPRELFLRVGGEHEWIPRGLDPYLRREVRRLGYRVVVIPGAWIHHLLPPTLPGILRQYFRNGVGAAYVRKFYPEFVIEQATAHGRPVPDRTSLARRGLRYAYNLLASFVTLRWIYLATLLTYATGYVWGTLTLREDSL